MRFSSLAFTAVIAIYGPFLASGFSPSSTFSRSLVKNARGTHSSQRAICGCNGCKSLSQRKSVSSSCKPGCNCPSCGMMKTLLQMSSTVEEAEASPSSSTDDDDIPPEVASLDGIESEQEAHNAARPARSSISSRGARAPRGKPLSELAVGSTLEGTVKSTTSYGAFVNIGYSSDALLHVSRLSDEFVSNVEDIVKAGDTVTVRVLSVDLDKGQVAVTMRSEEAEAAASAPKQQQNQRRPRTDRSAQAASITSLSETGFDDSKFFEGEVTSTLAFGAFVKFDLSLVAEGLSGQLEGLVHISSLAEERTESVESVCKRGDKVQVRLRSVDADNGRVSLAMISKEAEEASNSRRRGGGGFSEDDSGGLSLFESYEMGAKDWADSAESILAGQEFKNVPIIGQKRLRVK